jgi:V/A-type H+-transporting ATPase subunit E
MGGIKATIPAKNILIDNSFLSAYEKLKKEFKFDGGLSHE